jgi:hypothetical protein
MTSYSRLCNEVSLAKAGHRVWSPCPTIVPPKVYSTERACKAFLRHAHRASMRRLKSSHGGRPPQIANPEPLPPQLDVSDTSSHQPLIHLRYPASRRCVSCLPIWAWTSRNPSPSAIARAPVYSEATTGPSPAHGSMTRRPKWRLSKPSRKRTAARSCPSFSSATMNRSSKATQRGIPLSSRSSAIRGASLASPRRTTGRFLADAAHVSGSSAQDRPCRARCASRAWRCWPASRSSSL